MINTQERNTLAVNPVAVTRAYAKARMGDMTALRWLIEQHQAGNVAATRAIQDLDRVLPNTGQPFVA